MSPRLSAHRAGRLMVTVASLLAACSSPVDNPSAYDSEVFLCEPDQAERWESELDACRSSYERDRSCGGLASFSGVLQDQPITVDARLDSAAFSDVEQADGAVLRNEMKLGGVSPYFRFRLRLWEMGGPIDTDGGHTLGVLAGRSPDPEPPLEDDFVRASLRLSASSQSEESSADAGSVSISLQAEAEQVATFHLEIGKDVIDGCFHAFATEHNVSSSALP